MSASVKQRKQGPRLLAEAIAKAKAAGCTVRFQQFGEDASMPGALLGRVAGRINLETREIVVATHKSFDRPRSKYEMAKIIEHELEHAEGKDKGTDHPDLGLSCGGRWTYIAGGEL